MLYIKGGIDMKRLKDNMMRWIGRLLSPKHLVVATLWLILPQAILFAQSKSIKPGLWEIEQVFEMPGASQETFKNKWQHCVKEEDAKKGPVFSEAERYKVKPKEEECRIENLRYPKPGYVTYDIICGKKDFHAKVEYKYTETTFEGTSWTEGNEGKFTYKMKGRYLGPCKK
jgi:hypothetical protein